MALLSGVIALIIALFFIIYLFLIMPNVSHIADMGALSRNYAHRGLWDDKIPENSLTAFYRAVRAGYGIELDIQLSKDRQVMVFHDADLKRMCGIDRRVRELTCAELKTLRLKGTNETIPTLAEVLRLVGGRVPLMIEIKGERPEKALCVRTVRMLDAYNGAFCIEAFSPLILNWFKNYRPRYARGQLVTKIKKHDRKGSRTVNFLLSHMLLNFLSRPDFISVDQAYKKRPAFFFCTHILGVRGFAWTVRTKQEYLDCRSMRLFTIFEKIKP